MLTISRRSFLAYGATLALPVPARAALADEALCFLAVGDWGNSDYRGQALEVAGQMGVIAERSPAQFVISTGDNFYPRGVGSLNDSQWQWAFESVYSTPSLMCPWYAVLGNHDREGNDQAEIDYSAASRRWRMPARYYNRAEILSDGSSAEFFFLDTTPIAEWSWLGRWLGSDSQIRQQIDWLKRSLANSRARWKIVVGHHPIFSGGRHGNTPQMIEMVKPLLDGYGVQVYINGHDHDLQHIVTDGVHYLTSGAGASHDPTGPIAGTRYARGILGFLSVQLLPREMTFAFIDVLGRTAYSSTIRA